jgi:prepilin signal peptidase PulO-like enzyme (type II secretory pathway)
MALVVLMLLDAFFISGSRAGLCRSPFGLTDELSYDWPILLAHVILFACLLCMSAIDLEHYWVDIRFTNFAVLAGFILHGLWTPAHSRDWVRPSDTMAVTAVCAMLGLAFLRIVQVCRSVGPLEQELDESDEAPPLSEMKSSYEPASRLNSFHPPSRGFAWAAGLLLVGLFVALAAAPGEGAAGRFNARVIPPLLLFFTLIVRESTIVRSSDEEIAAAIEEERFSARATAWYEGALLLPALVCGAVGFAVMHAGGDGSDRLQDVLHARIPFPGLASMRQWTPLWGLATAATGYVIAGALGWAVRIVFTLLFGKEAFGTGDIHLMAAAGCVAGWPVAVLGFFLASLLALLGWFFALPFKRARALPLGPWLSLGFLIVVVLHEPIVHSTLIRQIVDTSQYLLSGNSQGLEKGFSP